MLVSCLCNLSARTSSPHLIQLHKNSLIELFGDEIGKKSHGGPFVPCFTSVHELLLLSGGGLEVSPQHSPHRGPAWQVPVQGELGMFYGIPTPAASKLPLRADVGLGRSCEESSTPRAWGDTWDQLAGDGQSPALAPHCGNHGIPDRFRFKGTLQLIPSHPLP